MALPPEPLAAPALGGWLDLWRHGALLAFALIAILLAWRAPGFLGVGNLANILAQAAIPGILALGLTLVIVGGGGNVLAGGLDLSLAANLGLCAAVQATLVNAGYGASLAIGLTLACGLVVGAVNGLAVTLLGLPPLLTTLASLNVVAGLELVLSENTVLPASAPWLDLLGMGSLLGIPAAGWVLLATALVLALLLQRTRYGLRLAAVGDHPEAARTAGLPVRTLVFSSYLLAGGCAGLAALLSVAWFSGSTPGSGELLLPVVAIAFLGTVFSWRSQPSVGGTLLAALLVGMLGNGFQLLGVSSFLVSGVQGTLILLVVAAASLRQEGNR
ncbi:ABC transporter permease [Pseudomonas benzopyrenica]|uniref:ABC transporter permease n=1 Tax=Pseudomonas benzopyrenica TaxID=2993566 RepID=A0ABZ2FIJ5_9PSED